MGATSTNIFELKFNNSPYLSFPLFYNSLPIDNNIRNFSKSLMDAKQFADFISLDRLTRYQQLSSLIDWPASWSFASFSLYVSKQQTNFHDDKIQSFRRKLLFNDLPTMEVLSLRNPSLYDPSWNCFHCNLTIESSSHLWYCQPSDPAKWSRLEAFDMIIDLAKESLKKHLQREVKKLPSLPAPDWLDQLARLRCWESPTSNLQLNNFDLLLGFILKELSDFVFSVLKNRNSTYNLLNKILFKLQDRAYKFIWIPRCQDMNEWEKSKNISPTAKRAKAPSRPSTSTLPRNKVQIDTSGALRSCFSKCINQGLQWSNYIPDFLYGLTVRMVSKSVFLFFEF